MYAGGCGDAAVSLGMSLHVPLAYAIRSAFLGAIIISAAKAQAPTPTAIELLGRWTDDYGNAFRITDSLFEQLPSSRYHIVEWNLAERYFVARNDAANKGDAGKWTRVDWTRFEGMAPFTWGFCFTAYRAATQEKARATPPADRETPRTGCNGFPFSRMKPVP